MKKIIYFHLIIILINVWAFGNYGSFEVEGCEFQGSLHPIILEDIKNAFFIEAGYETSFAISDSDHNRPF